jgi:circadian clock protein KaiC
MQPLFIFDEELGLALRPRQAAGLGPGSLVRHGHLFIEQVDAAELSPGEFAYKVRSSVDRQQVKTVVIDSLNGYQSAMPEEQFLILHIHELLQYLNRQGASTFLTLAQHGLVGEMKSPVDITYIADTVILLRYFEAFGQVRRAISIIKKRFGSHESSIREFRVSSGGIAVGPALAGFQGVLSGVPAFADSDPRSAARRPLTVGDLLPRHFRAALHPRSPGAGCGCGCKHPTGGRDRRGDLSRSAVPRARD